MSELLQRLPRPQDHRGSKPRCHWLTHGKPEDVASRLTRLIEPCGQVTADDEWMPQGFDQIDEAELHKTSRLLPPHVCSQLQDWWFASDSGRPKSASFDIASICTVNERKALLLVEAKAHEGELLKERVGKKLDAAASVDSRLNHIRIGGCIQEANLALAAQTHMPWALSRDTNYQLSNRFTWSWKVASVGWSVILVYLGFLNAEDIRKNKRRKDNVLLRNHGQWQDLVLSHSREVVPPSVWGNPWDIGGQIFVPLIRSTEIAYDRPVGDFIVQ